ncbi:MAG: hypothetical protein GX139_05720 [Armatimonadetes bacterium]|jgi:hypothetical protein|nr:hypothetical protein [Armatimonadota bacterium]
MSDDNAQARQIKSLLRIGIVLSLVQCLIYFGNKHLNLVSLVASCCAGIAAIGFLATATYRLRRLRGGAEAYYSPTERIIASVLLVFSSLILVGNIFLFALYYS